MRLILSRKGFDSAAGGGPSPILPDGTLVSLPIPEPNRFRRYAELHSSAGSLDTMLASLRGEAVDAKCRAHLDPDLNIASCPRTKGWVPAFGQDSSAATHLDKQGVGVGDLFIFFGWFRQTEVRQGSLRFVSGAPDLHVCFGWLRVGRVLESAIPGLEDHPHFRMRKLYDRNSRVYAASSTEKGGVFPKFGRPLQLTRPNSAVRSDWELPGFFHPSRSPRPLSYHRNPDRWGRPAGRCTLRAVGRGQEVVLDVGVASEAREWATSLGVRTD